MCGRCDNPIRGDYRAAPMVVSSYGVVGLFAIVDTGVPPALCRQDVELLSCSPF